MSIDYGPLATNLWKDNFTAFELDEIMRPKDDKTFAMVLNRLREGNHTKEDLIMFKTRELPLEVLPTNVTQLFQTNTKVNAHNKDVFACLKSEKVKIHSQDIVTGDIKKTMEGKLLRHIPNDPRKTMGLFYELSFGIGQRLELCLNAAVDDGLINGAWGAVKNSDRHHEGKVIFVRLQFDDRALENSIGFHRNIYSLMSFHQHGLQSQELHGSLELAEIQMLRYLRSFHFVQLLQNPFIDAKVIP